MLLKYLLINKFRKKFNTTLMENIKIYKKKFVEFFFYHKNILKIFFKLIFLKYSLINLDYILV